MYGKLRSLMPWKLLLPAMMAGALLTSCGESADTPPGGEAGPGVIKVGHYGSMTGSEATWGISSDRGMRMAIEEVNAEGGVNGQQLQLITYDTKGQTQEAGNAVTRLITSDKVTALLGEVASSLSLAGGRVAQQYGVPMISHASTNPAVTETGDMIHRICFIDPFQGYVGAKFIREELDLTRVAVLFDQTQAYSTGLKDDFIKALQALGGEVTTVQAYSGGDQDFSAQLNTIRATNPDALYVPGYFTEVGTIALQVRRLGITAPMVGGDGWDSPKLVEIAGPAIEGSYYSNHYTPEDPREELQAFVAKYKERHGNVPDAMAALGYDAALLLADAMRRAESLEGEQLADAISNTEGFQGVTGTITIDEDRNARKPAVVLTIKDGMPTYVASVEPPDTP